MSLRPGARRATRCLPTLDEGTIGTTANCTHYENGESPDGASHCRIGGGSGKGSSWGLRNVRVPLVEVEKGVVIGYKLQDVTDPQNRPPPPTEVNSPTPVFHYTPTTFDVM